MRIDGFDEVVVIDGEFRPEPGEPLREVVALAAHELVSGRKHRLFADELVAMKRPPYPIGERALIVSFYAIAEISCHLALGWELPINLVDLFPEFRNATNGRYMPNGHSLLQAALHYGLPAMDAVEKREMRDLILRGGPWTAEERAAIIEYNWGDVDITTRLLDRMLPFIDIECALLRGRYMTAAARIEAAGIPIDMDAYGRLEKHWEPLKDRLIQRIDADFGVFDGRAFKAEQWRRWLAENEITDRPESWVINNNQIAGTRLALDQDTFKQMARIYPEVEPMLELRRLLGKIRPNKLEIGRDGRSRTSLRPFTARTGRNQPASSTHIMGQAKWMRGLMRAKPGYVLVEADFSQQEFAIAASLSNDPAMRAAYNSGDAYLAFAQQAGAAPPDATAKSHEAVREQFKECALGTLYRMSADTLGHRVQIPKPYAEELIDLHRKLYPRYWAWSHRVVDYAMMHGHLFTTFGWQLFVEPGANPRSLANFPMQGNAADMLRIACCLAVERGVNLVTPVHDSLIAEVPANDMVGAIVTMRRAMVEASRIVLGNLTLRSELKIARLPLHYPLGKRILPMWNIVWQIIRDLEAGR